MRFSRLSVPAALLLVAGASLSGAQAADTPEPALQRAQQLVSDGRAQAGRALVDSVFRAAPAGSARQAEALYWRAVLAETAAEAERDYRRLAVEHPLSPRAEDALITLAQLELARRDHAQAIRHLERVALEHPRSAGRAHFWIARARLEQGNLPRACAGLATARSTAPANDVELRNQIEHYAERCAGVDTTAGVRVAAQPAGPAAAPARSPVQTPAQTQPPAQTTPAPAQQQPAAPAPAPAASTAGGFTVQVAAFNARGPAEQLRERLAARGVQARVIGDAAPFRVRTGRYATRAEAALAAQDLRQRGIVSDAFVTEAEPR